jgi:hypothetical protein
MMRDGSCCVPVVVALRGGGGMGGIRIVTRYFVTQNEHNQHVNYLTTRNENHIATPYSSNSSSSDGNVGRDHGSTNGMLYGCRRSRSERRERERENLFPP